MRVEPAAGGFVELERRIKVLPKRRSFKRQCLAAGHLKRIGIRISGMRNPPVDDDGKVFERRRGFGLVQYWLGRHVQRKLVRDAADGDHAKIMRAGRGFGFKGKSHLQQIRGPVFCRVRFGPRGRLVRIHRQNAGFHPVSLKQQRPGIPEACAPNYRVHSFPALRRHGVKRRNFQVRLLLWRLAHSPAGDRQRQYQPDLIHARLAAQGSRWVNRAPLYHAATETPSQDHVQGAEQNCRFGGWVRT